MRSKLTLARLFWLLCSVPAFSWVFLINLEANCEVWASEVTPKLWGGGKVGGKGQNTVREGFVVIRPKSTSNYSLEIFEKNTFCGNQNFPRKMYLRWKAQIAILAPNSICEKTVSMNLYPTFDRGSTMHWFASLVCIKRRVILGFRDPYPPKIPPALTLIRVCLKWDHDDWLSIVIDWLLLHNLVQCTVHSGYVF